VAADRVLPREPEVDVEVLGAFKVDRVATASPEKLRAIANGTADPYRVVRAQHVPVGIVADAHLIPLSASWPRRDDDPGIVDELLMTVGVGAIGAFLEAPDEALDGARQKGVVGVEKHEECSRGRLEPVPLRGARPLIL